MNAQKIVLYCRASTKEQLLLQEQKLRHYALEHHQEIVAVVFDMRSGKHIRRLKLQMAVRLARRYNAAIVINDLSRISRHLKEAAKFMGQLKRRNVSLLSASEEAEDQARSIITLAAIVNAALV